MAGGRYPGGMRALLVVNPRATAATHRARDLLVRGVIDCGAMITHAYGLDGYTEAIDTFRTNAGLKVQVMPNR